MLRLILIISKKLPLDNTIEKKGLKILERKHYPQSILIEM